MSEPRAYYNEIDTEAVAALHQLIADDVIMPGDVDSRSIKEVTPDDVRGYTQCHFFAGAGLWSVAARRAGWPDRRPLWSGSCPCQGESLAGKRRGADDPRHLWPDFFRLISACRPAVIVGEQVAAAAGTHWLDGTCADLESVLYAARAVNIPACAVDAPHIRQRLYWLAVADGESSGSRAGVREAGTQRHRAESSNRDGRNDVLADCDSIRQSQQERPFTDERRRLGDSHARGRNVANTEGQRSGRDEPQRRSERRTVDGRPDASSNMVGASRERRGEGLTELHVHGRRAAVAGADGGTGNARAVGVTQGDANGPRLERHGRRVAEAAQGWGEQDRSVTAADARNGSWWADAEWINCHDGKARRAKPGIRMLVDGMAGRIGLWRLAGNSIVPEIAAEVLAAFLEDEAEQHFRLSLQGGVFA